ncbi:MAG: GNAT family N-acetyltransferase [Lawsonibacter sp.]|nr:GNAT family N-acetyltransferase [Lawsonibacter sp.]
MPSCTFRPAVPGDEALILSFIRALADYEHMSDQVVATPELLREWIFEKQKAEVLFAVAEGNEVGFALFFHNFSTFLGRAGVYLEDLFVLPQARGSGYGKALLQELARITRERGCGRLEWACLDWNRPSIDFYTKRMRAVPMDQWTTYRLTGETLEEAADPEHAGTVQERQASGEEAAKMKGG